jgi:uncharacterized circularly permuted ATP-grasp superfamily protein
MKFEALLRGYAVNGNIHDEVFEAPGKVRPHYQALYELFSEYDLKDFQDLNELVHLSFFNQGITFAVYSKNAEGGERIFPFDLFPRVIPQAEWEMIERGIQQRNEALNLFLHDLYHEQRIIKEKIVPAELIHSSKHFLKEMKGINPPGGIYNHVSGTDLIKHRDGQYYVLEDNIRCPSGVSYVLANRVAMKRNLGTLFRQCNIAPVQFYAVELLDMLHSVAPEGISSPNIVILTPGIYNSAYFEHAFLAQQMGIELVEGQDLFVEGDFVFMNTIYGPRRVDVIYRRVDDDFIDPEVFREDSVLGVRGLMRAYAAGHVSLINAPGTGVADDKAVYIHMPEIVKFYLDQEPILHNVHTYHCDRPEDAKYVEANFDELVIKPVDASGGYGIVFGSQSDAAAKKDCLALIKANPRGYIAQPEMSLSTHATYIEEKQRIEPRHIDLRVFSLQGKDRSFVLKGGLSRVALREGSLVVNSSQGGGSKDTWVLEE